MIFEEQVMTARSLHLDDAICRDKDDVDEHDNARPDDNGDDEIHADEEDELPLLLNAIWSLPSSRSSRVHRL